MRERLAVNVGSDGIPKAQVSPRDLWELVEHLSCQRVAALYHHFSECFVVSFPKLDIVAAQQTLDDWADIKMEMAA